MFYKALVSIIFLISLPLFAQEESVPYVDYSGFGVFDILDDGSLVIEMRNWRNKKNKGNRDLRERGQKADFEKVLFLALPVIDKSLVAIGNGLYILSNEDIEEMTLRNNDDVISEFVGPIPDRNVVSLLSLRGRIGIRYYPEDSSVSINISTNDGFFTYQGPMVRQNQTASLARSSCTSECSGGSCSISCQKGCRAWCKGGGDPVCVCGASII